MAMTNKAPGGENLKQYVHLGDEPPTGKTVNYEYWGTGLNVWMNGKGWEFTERQSGTLPMEIFNAIKRQWPAVFKISLRGAL